MNEHFAAAIIKRIDRLERDLRRWKLLGRAALACLGLAVLVGATSSYVAEEIRAQRFVFVDRDGQARGGLSVDPDGLVALRLLDQHGLPRALLSVTADGASALSLVERGKSRVILNLGPGLVVYDKSGLPRATLGVTPAGSPTLTLTDERGKIVWSAP